MQSTISEVQITPVRDVNGQVAEFLLNNCPCVSDPEEDRTQYADAGVIAELKNRIAKLERYKKYQLVSVDIRAAIAFLESKVQESGHWQFKID